MTNQNPGRRSGRQYLAAVVLGTALATMGGASSAQGGEISSNALNNVSRYCTACWRNAGLPVDRWGDCTQDVLQRLLQRLRPGAWGHLLTAESDERKELVRAIDAVKKRTQRDRKRTVPMADGLADRRGCDKLRDERAAVGEAARELLTARQQRILQMTFEGWGVADMAGELGLKAERVSDEKYKAIQKLRTHFQAYPEC